MNTPDTKALMSQIEQAKRASSEASNQSSRDDIGSDLKLEINRLIWQYSPPETTLGAADDMACKILSSIFAGRYLV